MNISVPGSVSKWLVTIKDGVARFGTSDSSKSRSKANEVADYGTNLLWRRFGSQLVKYARAELRGVSRQSHDAEGIALTAIHKVTDRVLHGEYVNLSNRKELWYMLLAVSRNESINHRRQVKRRTAIEQSETNCTDNVCLLSIEDQRTPSAESLAIMDEQCELLLKKLDEQDPSGLLRQIALMRLHGESKSSIAANFGHTRRTVRARLALIQAIWTSYLNSPHDEQ